LPKLTFELPFEFRTLLETFHKKVIRVCEERGLTPEQTNTVVKLRKTVRKHVRENYLHNFPQFL